MNIGNHPPNVSLSFFHAVSARICALFANVQSPKRTSNLNIQWFCFVPPFSSHFFFFSINLNTFFKWYSIFICAFMQKLQQLNEKKLKTFCRSFSFARKHGFLKIFTSPAGFFFFVHSLECWRERAQLRKRTTACKPPFEHFLQAITTKKNIAAFGMVDVPETERHIIPLHFDIWQNLKISLVTKHCNNNTCADTLRTHKLRHEKKKRNTFHKSPMSLFWDCHKTTMHRDSWYCIADLEHPIDLSFKSVANTDWPHTHIILRVTDMTCSLQGWSLTNKMYTCIACGVQNVPPIIPDTKSSKQVVLKSQNLHKSAAIEGGQEGFTTCRGPHWKALNWIWNDPNPHTCSQDCFLCFRCAHTFPPPSICGGKKRSWFGSCCCNCDKKYLKLTELLSQ